VTSAELHRVLVATELLLGLATLLALFFVVAPYGRHLRRGFGPTMPARLGWVAMESPSVLLFLAVYLSGSRRTEAAPLALLALWQLHYLQRTLVHPFRMRSPAPMPLLVAGLGFSFNLMNAWINARWISELGAYPAGWLSGWRFLAGAALFLAGMAVNVGSDRALARLRAGGDGGYRIPRGGLFERISCPNYLGEIVEWSGWAIASWSTAGLAFALYTVANLAPRALAHHRWYRERFAEYPPERRALVPFLL